MKTHPSVLQFFGSHIGNDSLSQSGYITLKPPWDVNDIFSNNFKEKVCPWVSHQRKLYQAFRIY